jgi:pimeloyl-ACP methyl ester carboxylesterase
MVQVQRVAFDGGELELEVAGAGPNVVFLHPGLWDRRTWDRQFERFADRYCVMRFDARGYGRSSRLEPGVPYSNLEDLAAVMDAAAMASAALVGCSMGGATAAEFAIAHPERVEALVLGAPGINGDLELEPEEEAEFARVGASIEAAMAAGDLERAREAQLVMFAPLGTTDPAGARVREIAFENLHELTMDESVREDLTPPALERLQEIAAPTLVLPADHDPIAFRRLARIYAERIPNARLVEIAETDHVLNLRQPDAFDEVVLAFLEDVLG